MVTTERSGPVVRTHPKEANEQQGFIKDRRQHATGIGNAELPRVKHPHLKCSLQGG